MKYHRFGEKGAQKSSLLALHGLFVAAPDYGDRLIEDCLPALCDILEDVNRSLEVYVNAFHLLTEVVRQSSHSMIIESGIIAYLVQWLRDVFLYLLATVN